VREHTTHFDDCGCKSAEYEKRIAALEAELAALKARECIECKHVATCGLHVFWMAPGHFAYTDGHPVRFCSEWTQREAR
jgi:hypothetical protein